MDILENKKQWQRTFQKDWVSYFKETGKIDWKRYPLPKNGSTPSGPGIDPGKSRLMLISSAGGYLRTSQQPFDSHNPMGDYTIRQFPSHTPLDEIAFAHEHYNHSSIEQDPQVLLPLRHLDALVADGAIGEIAPSVISFMGYQPDAARLVDETAPVILKAAQEEKVHAALLVPA